MMSSQEKAVTHAFNGFAAASALAVPLALGAGMAPDPWNLVCGAGASACLLWAGVAYVAGRNRIAEAFVNLTQEKPATSSALIAERLAEIAKKREELAARRALRGPEVADPEGTTKLPAHLASPRYRRGNPQETPKNP